MREQEHGDRTRRLAAVMRFIAQMRDVPGEEPLVESLIQAAAVWYDLDARAYRRGLDGRFRLAIHLPGADVADDPVTLDARPVLTGDAPCRLTSLSELEQLGWRGQQIEVLLLPVPVAETVRWIVAVSGPVDRDVEDLLLLVCRTAGAAIERQDARRARDVAACLGRRMSRGREAFQARARGLVEEVCLLLSAGAGRLSVRVGDRRALTLATTGDGWDGSTPPAIQAGSATLEPSRLVFGLALGNEGVGIFEIAAVPERPFTPERAVAARSAADAVGAWLCGVSSSAGRLHEEAGRAAPPFEREIQTELDRARRLSLKGGVLVASVPGMAPDPAVLSGVIQVVRTELRSSDLLGQLAGGDIAAVLVRTSSDGVARAAVRVRQRLDALARERRLPAVVVGHALYPGAGADSPSSLVARARHEAGLTFSN
ncbi:MAG: hypothetical protein KBA95_19320 [Acidobacteria bacterium]|nr:hypothetical protein [Acidobacteriota bacterium]